MNIYIDGDRPYPIVRTNASVEGLSIKASLLPDGPDIFRQPEDELKQAFIDGPSFHLQDMPLDRIIRNSATEMFTGQHIEPTEEELIEAILERAQEEIWENDGYEVVASKHIRSIRDVENFAYADIWMFEISKSVGAGIAVIPDTIALRGLAVQISGRYKPMAFEYIIPESQTDPNGWSLLAYISYDFEEHDGSVYISP